MSPKNRKEQAPDWDALRERASTHAEGVAELEIRALQDRLKWLYPTDVPVTIQLFQPVHGGRLVDVGPRPRGASDALVFQGNAVGRTGDTFQDKQVSHRYIPWRKKVRSIPPGTFTNEILQLEKLRYPEIGKWTGNGPPPASWIHQLPLAPLPQTLGPRKNAERYRYANLGAVYTMSKRKGPSTIDEENLLQRLILYALRSGEIAQQVRFEALCGGANDVPNPTECRVRAAQFLPADPWSDRECETEKIDSEWRANIDGGLCRLVGTLILHHHWWHPYDPVAYELLSRLTDRDYLERIYHLHLSCVPEYPRKQDDERQRTLLQLITILSDDIAQIISSYRNAGLGTRQRERIHKAVMTMVRQLCGQRVRRYYNCHDEDNGKLAIGKQLQFRNYEHSVEVQFLDCRAGWGEDLTQAMRQHSFCCPVLKASTLKTKKQSTVSSEGPLAYCQFILSLLSPHTSPIQKPSRYLRTTDQCMVQSSGKAYVLCDDKNGDCEHFLYWHTRAMLTLRIDSPESEGEI